MKSVPKEKEFVVSVRHTADYASLLCPLGKSALHELFNVRRELWESDPLTTKVNDVASLWGFWHMGQFAADYRKLFNELPSETLKKKSNKVEGV